MVALEFTGNITLDEIFKQNRKLIYDQVYLSISKNLSSDGVNVIKISINEIDYSIFLEKSKFIGALTNAIKFYESDEQQEYELCKKCIDLIAELKKNN